MDVNRSVRFNRAEIDIFDAARRAIRIAFPEATDERFTQLGVLRTKNSHVYAKNLYAALVTYEEALPIIRQQAEKKWWYDNFIRPSTQSDVAQEAAIETLRDKGLMPLVIDPPRMVEAMVEIRAMQVVEVERAVALAKLGLVRIGGEYEREIDPKDPDDDRLADAYAILEAHPFPRLANG